MKIFESLLSQAATEALEGEMGDDTRVLLYKLALSVVSEEFYRIEQVYSGAVSPEVLVFVQQIALLCSEDLTKEKLVEGLNNATQTISGGSESDVGEVPSIES